MIELNLNGKKYNIKNSNDELNINEFQIISNILSRDKDDYYFLKWLEVLSFLSDDESIQDEISREALVGIITEFKVGDKVKEYPKQFETDGFIYKPRFEEDGSKPFYSGKDLALIEMYIKDKPTDFLKYIIAIIFKREDFDKHYLPSHIEQKAKILGEEMSIEYAIPFILDLQLTILKDIDVIKKSFDNEEA